MRVRIVPPIVYVLGTYLPTLRCKHARPRLKSQMQIKGSNNRCNCSTVILSFDVVVFFFF